MTDGATGVGVELARAREARGLALVDVAQQLRLAPRQIESIEHERFDALPGPTIARGMLRNYARLLELDPEPLLERLGARLDAPDAERLAERFSQAVPFSDTARRSTLVYVGLSLVVLAVVGTMGYQWREERTASRELAFVPAAKVPLEPPRVLAEAAAPPAPEPADAPKVPAVPALERVAEPPRAAASTATPSTPAPPPAAPKPAAAAPAAATPAEASPTQPLPLAAKPADPAGPTHRLVLRFEEESWVEITDGRGRVLVWSLLPAGTQRAVEGSPPFSVVLGNARHVELYYDGRFVDLGPRTRGDVARLKLE